MLFTETKLAGAFIIDLERQSDARGFFARSWCEDEFAAHGIYNLPRQANMSSNPTLGTLRGLHYQLPPHQETKLVRCTRGAIFDVIVDLREESATYGEWLGVELTAENGRQLFVPTGFAHGFLTLAPFTEWCTRFRPSMRPVPKASCAGTTPAMRIDGRLNPS